MKKRPITILKEIDITRRVVDEFGKKTNKVIGKKILYKRPNGSKGVMHQSLDVESPTVQSQEKESNINNIVRKHSNKEIFNRFVYDVNNDGVIDVSDITDYHGSMVKITRAKQQFMQLPSRIRREFDNSPHKFVDFCSKEENLPKMYKLGLAIEPKKEPTPTPTPTVAKKTQPETSKETKNA